jgi:hypothetical protein
LGRILVGEQEIESVSFGNEEKNRGENLRAMQDVVSS